MRKKIAQLFICKNPDSKKEIESFIKQGIGGFMIGFGGEVVSKKQKNLEGDSKNSLKKFTKYLRSKEDIPLFLAIDGEGGEHFNRLRYISNLKNQRFYGKKYEKDKKIKFYKNAITKYAELMNDLDLNMNFAPVLEKAKRGYKGYLVEEKILVKNRSELYASERSYSDKMSTITALGPAAVKIYQKHKIICTVKHFPSYGLFNKDQDPHVVLPKIKITKENLLKELKSFKKAFKNGCHAVMIGHGVYSCLGRYPTSLSSKTLPFLKELKFKGLIVADELNMMAISEFYGKKSPGNVAVEAVKVNDILLISHPNTFKIMVNAIMRAAKKDKKLAKKIDESYEKILHFKKIISGI